MITPLVAAEMVVKQDLLTKCLFELSSVDDLLAFNTDLDPHDPFSRSLGFLIGTWVPLLVQDDATRFEPRLFVTEDLSAAMLGTCPVVFMGSNAWATKPFLGLEAHIKKADLYSQHFERIRHIFADKKIVLTVIPEKDYVIDQQFLNTGRFANVDAAMQRLANTCIKSGCSFVYNEYLAPLKQFDAAGDFEYFDTHLPARHYIQVFARILSKLGFSWLDIASQFTLTDDRIYGDLSTKFTARDPVFKFQRVPLSRAETCSVIEGNSSFAEPLGSTWQRIKNARPLKSGKVLVLGDSHSSILSQHRLTYLLASTFEQCDFVWNPFGVREIPATTGADMVILEISQRFLF